MYHIGQKEMIIWYIPHIVPDIGSQSPKIVL